MGWDAPWHWVVIAVLVIALFGYKKLPDASRALGRSLRIFKTEIKGMTEDDKARAKAQEAAEPAEPKALPPAQLVKNDVRTNQPARNAASGTVAGGGAPGEAPKARPRPAPSPHGRAESTAKAD